MKNIGDSRHSKHSVYKTGSYITHKKSTCPKNDSWGKHLMRFGYKLKEKKTSELVIITTNLILYLGDLGVCYIHSMLIKNMDKAIVY